MTARKEMFAEINKAIGTNPIIAVDVTGVAESVVCENKTQDPLPPFVVISNRLFDDFSLGEKLSGSMEMTFREVLNEITELEKKFADVEDIIYINVREVHDILSEKVSKELMEDVNSGADFSDCLYEISDAINEASNIDSAVVEKSDRLTVFGKTVEKIVSEFGVFRWVAEDAIALLEDDGYSIGDYNPHRRAVWLINGNILALGDNEQDALDNAADQGSLDEFSISQAEYDERCDSGLGSTCITLGNAGKPFDGDLISHIHRLVTA